MRKEQRDVTVGLLFGNMMNQLDELSTQGIHVPSEVYLCLGMLQGNVVGIMDHIAINSEHDYERLNRKIREMRESMNEAEAKEDAEHEEELPTRMEQVQRNSETYDERAPANRRKKVVNLRGEATANEDDDDDD